MLCASPPDAPEPSETSRTSIALLEDVLYLALTDLSLLPRPAAPHMGLYTPTTATAAHLKALNQDVKTSFAAHDLAKSPPRFVKKDTELSITDEILIKAGSTAHSPALSPIIGSWPVKAPSSAVGTGKQRKEVVLQTLAPLPTDPTVHAPTHTNTTQAPDYKNLLLSTTTFQNPKTTSTLLIRLILFRKILILNDGRDKVLKCIQYACKVALWSQLLPFLAATYPNLAITLRKRLAGFIPHLSITRKLVRLGNFLAPVEALARGGDGPAWGSLFALCNHVNALLTGLADDGVTLGKVGMLEPRAFLQRWADRLWLVGIGFDWAEVGDRVARARRTMALMREKRRVVLLQQGHGGTVGVGGNGGSGGGGGDRVWKTSEFVDEDGVHVGSAEAGADVTQVVIENATKKEKEAERELWLCNLTRAKLVADFLFCAFDVFSVVKRVEARGGLKVGNFSKAGRIMVTARQLQQLQDVAALVAAILGTWKLYSSQVGK
ncbi:hypothetical protein BC830DRAFT_1165692 [Chytriomyces sp. MP71]|nr:hypothetical protein BC830DRAFT_1165692 [Chytriomyces sp. MP71]